jgi:hypothetical protein
MSIGNPYEFVNNLQDSRFLLFYPDIVNQLCKEILLFSKDDLDNMKNIFKELIDYIGVDPLEQLSSIINVYSSSVLSKQFPKVLLLNVSDLRNNQIPPITNDNKLNMISQSAIPFTSSQFLAVLNALPDNKLSYLLNTLRPYQITELTRKIESYKYIGVF